MVIIDNIIIIVVTHTYGVRQLKMPSGYLQYVSSSVPPAKSEGRDKKWINSFTGNSFFRIELLTLNLRSRRYFKFVLKCIKHVLFPHQSSVSLKTSSRQETNFAEPLDLSTFLLVFLPELFFPVHPFAQTRY